VKPSLTEKHRLTAEKLMAQSSQNHSCRGNIGGRLQYLDEVTICTFANQLK